MKYIRGVYSKYTKNRSSKNIYFSGMVGPGTKPSTWSMSNEELKKLSKENGNAGNIYEKELNRRSKNAAKRKTPRPSSKSANN